MTKIDYIAQNQQIVLNHIDTSQYKVFLFGSRACGNFQHSSDIDVGIWGKERIPLKAKLAIEEELEESIVPYKVDIVDFSLVDETFKKFALEKIVEWR